MKKLSQFVPITEETTALPDLPTDVENIPADDGVDLKLTSFKIYQKQINRGVKSSGNFGSFFKGSGSHQHLELQYLAAMFSGKTTGITIGKEKITSKMGFGISVTLKIKNIKSKVRFNFASIAANSELGMIEGEYSIKGHGIDNTSLFKYLSIDKLSGNFNYESYQAILELVQKMKIHITENLDEVRLAPIEVLRVVPFDNSISPVDMQKFYFASKYLSKNYSLEKLTGKIREEGKEYMDEGICKFIYNYFNVDNAYINPTPIARKEAKDWINGITSRTNQSSNDEWIPIISDLDHDGNFLALSHLGKDLKPHSIDSGFEEGENFEVIFNKASKSFSSELKLASIGGVNGQYDEETIFMDAVQYRDITSSEPIGGLIHGTRYGIGVRFKLHFSNVEFGIKITKSNIGAIMDLGLANIEYEITGIGINDEKLFNLFPGPIDLNNSSYSEIIDALSSITESIGNLNEKDLNYQPFMIWVQDKKDVDPLNYHRHFIFCQRCFSERLSLENALAKGGALRLDKKLIKEIYSTCNLSSADQKVSKSRKNEAKDWLNI